MASGAWVGSLAVVAVVFAACGGISQPSEGDGGAEGGAPAGGSDAGATLPGRTCGMPMEVGPCEALVPRFWFDPNKGRCVRFTWGGCGGNGNNFETLERCIATCASTVEDPCSIVDCEVGTSCVYVGQKPVCAPPCDEDGGGTCALPGQTCSCASSCPACRDCRRVCTSQP